MIERIFGIFKSGFTIFKTAPPFPYVTQAELVLACASLHNFFCKECRSDEFLVELENDSSPSYLDMEEEHIELLSQTQQQQRADANALRLNIAEATWNNRPQIKMIKTKIKKKKMIIKRMTMTMKIMKNK